MVPALEGNTVMVFVAQWLPRKEGMLARTPNFEMGSLRTDRTGMIPVPSDRDLSADAAAIMLSEIGRSCLTCSDV